ISTEQLAKSTQIKERIIKEILAERQDITPDISYRLGLFFDLREDY
ncbi:2792_t:CDS:1, partial [Ambispora gerdemannii]